jgi:hypothetical protein
LGEKKAQRNPAEKPLKLRLNAIGRWARQAEK